MKSSAQCTPVQIPWAYNLFCNIFLSEYTYTFLVVTYYIIIMLWYLVYSFILFSYLLSPTFHLQCDEHVVLLTTADRIYNGFQYLVFNLNPFYFFFFSSLWSKDLHSYVPVPVIKASKPPTVLNKGLIPSETWTTFSSLTHKLTFVNCEVFENVFEFLFELVSVKEKTFILIFQSTVSLWTVQAMTSHNV